MYCEGVGAVVPSVRSFKTASVGALEMYVKDTTSSSRCNFCQVCMSKSICA
jgi:hypothetical protein